MVRGITPERIGYVLCPSHEWDANALNGRGQWVLAHHRKLVGQTREIFHRWNGWLYYVGTYLFLEIPCLPVEEYGKLHKIGTFASSSETLYVLSLRQIKDALICDNFRLCRLWSYRLSVVVSTVD
jgi:hypothetical protein